MSACAAHFNVHDVRFVTSGNFCLGKRRQGFRNMYGRRSLNPLKTTVGMTTLHRRLALLGSVNYSTVHASRGVPTPRLIRLYSRVKFVVVVRPFSR